LQPQLKGIHVIRTFPDPNREEGVTQVRRVFTFIVALYVSLLSSMPATAQWIGVFGDSVGASCNITIPYPGPPVDVFVLFTPGGEVDEIDAAWFKVEGLPVDWPVEEFPNDAAESVTGEVFSVTGGQIGFPDCQSTPTLLYRARVTPTSTAESITLTIRSNLFRPTGFECPGVGSCSPPSPPCVPEAYAIVNGNGQCVPCDPALCPVTDVPEFTVRRPWGVVKVLYR
jgi:hypothetical protein